MSQEQSSEVLCPSAGDSTELVVGRNVSCPTQCWGDAEFLGADNRLQGEVLQDGGEE